MSLKRFTFGSDLHGDCQDEAAVKAFFDFDKIWKPDIRVFGGDLIDLRGLRKGASQEEKAESMRSDIDAGQRFLKQWKPNYWLRGNHCERLWETAQNSDGVVADYARMGCEQFETICRTQKTTMLPYHKRHGVLQIGHLKMLHGFYGGIYASRQTATVYGSCLFGHIHCIDEHAIAGLERRVARAVGALCELDLDYNSRQPNTLRQAHGWAYGILNEKTGNYFVTQAEEIDGVWMLPTEFKQL
jgi:hypothetical protein